MNREMGLVLIIKWKLWLIKNLDLTIRCPQEYFSMCISEYVYGMFQLLHKNGLSILNIPSVNASSYTPDYNDICLMAPNKTTNGHTDINFSKSFGGDFIWMSF